MELSQLKPYPDNSDLPSFESCAKIVDSAYKLKDAFGISNEGKIAIVLLSKVRELQEANKALQEQADRTATLKFQGKFGDHARPLA